MPAGEAVELRRKRWLPRELRKIPMIKRGRAAWYIRRLTRMSPPEIVYPIAEGGRRQVDGRRRWAWDRFGRLEGRVQGLPGLTPSAATPTLLAAAREAAVSVGAGRFSLLGADWPLPEEERWWNTDFWLLDPISGQHWPG